MEQTRPFAGQEHDARSKANYVMNPLVFRQHVRILKRNKMDVARQVHHSYGRAKSTSIDLHMAVEAEELAAGLKRISELTEQLIAIQKGNSESRELAECICREIASARDQLKRLPPAKK